MKKFIINLLENVKELLMLPVVIRLLLAVTLGGIIGLDRDLKNHAAGLRTHMIVCVGSAIAMMTNEYIVNTSWGVSGDPTRMGAQVISGIGFLGAGTILVRKNDQVKGLTTAAGLWATATLGLAIGSGYYALSILGGVLLAIIMIFFHPIKNILITKNEVETISIMIYSVNGLRNFFHYTLEREIKIIDLVVEDESMYSHKERVGTVFYATIKLDSHYSKDDIIESLRIVDGIKYVSEV